MPSAPPGNCPVCDHNLRGLPPAHRCPECDFAYDEHTRIWRWPTPARTHLKIALQTIILGAAVADMFLFQSGRLALFNVICYGTLLAVSTVHTLRLRPRRAFLALNPDGFRIRGWSISTAHVDHFTWPDIGPFHADTRTLAVGLNTELQHAPDANRDSAAPTDESAFVKRYPLDHFLKTDADAAEFAVTLAAARARLAQSPPPP